MKRIKKIYFTSRMASGNQVAYPKWANIMRGTEENAAVPRGCGGKDAVMRVSRDVTIKREEV